MMLAMLLLAVQPGPPAPDPRLACAPVRNLTAAGPPPPVFSLDRTEITSRAQSYLSVHRCREGDALRVQHAVSGERRQMEWVTTAQCPAIGRWIAAAGRLRLPSPALDGRESPNPPPGAAWLTLGARQIPGKGRTGNMELDSLELPGRPSSLGRWFHEGERVFRQCRAQGHGGEGFLDPFRSRGRR